MVWGGKKSRIREGQYERKVLLTTPGKKKEALDKEGKESSLRGGGGKGLPTKKGGKKDLSGREKKKTARVV